MISEIKEEGRIRSQDPIVPERVKIRSRIPDKRRISYQKGTEKDRLVEDE